LQKAGFSAYLVGGCVRNLLLDAKPRDWDITTNAKPEQITSLFAKTFYENEFGTVTIVSEETTDETLRNVEVTPFRTETTYSDKRHPDQVKFGDKLEDDLKRRDFTINALAYNPAQGQLVDLFGGEKDLKDKLIKAVGNPDERFSEDPLRMLRAIRLAAELGFTINSETAQAIQNKADLIKVVSKERIRDEFSKIILSKNPMIGLILAHKLSILAHFLPELEEGVGMKQTKEHKYAVFEHTIRVVQHSADRDYKFHVRLAALFHDVGKPRTRAWSPEKGDWTFYGHDIVGARMTQEILNRLKFPKKTIEIVVKLVRNHMFFTDIERITLSAVRRIIRNVGPEHIWELMEVRRCDRTGMGRPKESPYRLRKYESMIEEALRSPTSVGMLKITGNDVIRETKLNPGPKIGHILHVLLEEVLEKPELNEGAYLISQAKELAKLEEGELKTLGEKGKEKKEETEQAELEKIRSKFHVK
ncbi:MAG: CCA tRNA nucleotidyltransferase, partial [Candidatus Vogelbacteria bacterium]|nr:CCA tRNA nucleotidyltransferase [Candidatus Vogelbacteria bacterium]